MYTYKGLPLHGKLLDPSVAGNIPSGLNPYAPNLLLNDTYNSMNGAIVRPGVLLTQDIHNDKFDVLRQYLNKNHRGMFKSIGQNVATGIHKAIAKQPVTHFNQPGATVNASSTPDPANSTSVTTAVDNSLVASGHVSSAPPAPLLAAAPAPPAPPPLPLVGETIESSANTNPPPTLVSNLFTSRENSNPPVQQFVTVQDTPEPATIVRSTPKLITLPSQPEQIETYVTGGPNNAGSVTTPIVPSAPILLMKNDFKVAPEIRYVDQPKLPLVARAWGSGPGVYYRDPADVKQVFGNTAVSVMRHQAGGVTLDNPIAARQAINQVQPAVASHVDSSTQTIQEYPDDWEFNTDEDEDGDPQGFASDEELIVTEYTEDQIDMTPDDTFYDFLQNNSQLIFQQDLQTEIPEVYLGQPGHMGEPLQRYWFRSISEWAQNPENRTNSALKNNEDKFRLRVSITKDMFEAMPLEMDAITSTKGQAIVEITNQILYEIFVDDVAREGLWRYKKLHLSNFSIVERLKRGYSGMLQVLIAWTLSMRDHPDSKNNHDVMDTNWVVGVQVYSILGAMAYTSLNGITLIDRYMNTTFKGNQRVMQETITGKRNVKGYMIPPEHLFGVVKAEQKHIRRTYRWFRVKIAQDLDRYERVTRSYEHKFYKNDLRMDDEAHEAYEKTQ